MVESKLKHRKLFTICPQLLTLTLKHKNMSTVEAKSAVGKKAFLMQALT